MSESTHSFDALRSELMSEAIMSSFFAQGCASDAGSSKAPSPVPFLYNFADFAMLTLSEGADILIMSDKAGKALSTRTGAFKPVDEVDEARWVPFGVIRLALEGEGLSKRQRKRFRTVLQHTKDSLIDRCEDLEKVSGALRVAMDELQKNFVDGFTEIHKSGAAQRSTPVALSPGHASATVEELVERVARGLEDAIPPAATRYTLVLRSLVNRCMILWGITYKGTPNGIRSADIFALDEKHPSWQHDVLHVLSRGFLRITPVSDHRFLLAVPCHFGGIPWIALCGEFEPDEKGHWLAYMTYRDLIPRLNEAIRLQGQVTLFSEMRSQLVSAAEQAGGGQQKDTVEAAWGSLRSVFPIHRPVLRPVPRASTDTIDVDDTPCTLDFDTSQPLLLPASQCLRTQQTWRWAEFSREMLQRHFLDPIRFRQQEQYLKGQVAGGEQEQRTFAHQTAALIDSLHYNLQRSGVWNELHLTIRGMMILLHTTVAMYRQRPANPSAPFEITGEGTSPLQAYLELASVIAAMRCADHKDEQVYEHGAELLNEKDIVGRFARDLDWKVRGESVVPPDILSTKSFGIMFVYCLAQSLHHSIVTKMRRPEIYKPPRIHFSCTSERLHVRIFSPGDCTSLMSKDAKDFKRLAKHFIPEGCAGGPKPADGEEEMWLTTFAMMLRAHL